MNRKTYGWHVGALAIVAQLTISTAGAQLSATEQPWIPEIFQNIPWGDLPPEVADNLRKPGEPVIETPLQRRDLPPPRDVPALRAPDREYLQQFPPRVPDPERQKEIQDDKRRRTAWPDPLEESLEAALRAKGKPYSRPDHPLVGSDAAEEHRYLERALGLGGEIPPDAYTKAWEHIQHMSPATKSVEDLLDLNR
jgi:hypothetical protein